ncbi:MAG: DUF1877 family protein [Bacteroidota bacterium]
MGMVATLVRIKADDLKYLEVGLRPPEPPLEVIDVDVLWESILFLFGNGVMGASVTGDIFMPSEAIGSEEEIEYGGGIRYHTPDVIVAVNRKIGHLTDADLRAIADPNKMQMVYRFRPEYVDEIVEHCLAIIKLFATAEQNGDIVLGSID